MEVCARRVGGWATLMAAAWEDSLGSVPVVVVEGLEAFRVKLAAVAACGLRGAVLQVAVVLLLFTPTVPTGAVIAITSVEVGPPASRGHTQNRP